MGSFQKAIKEIIELGAKGLEQTKGAIKKQGEYITAETKPMIAGEKSVSNIDTSMLKNKVVVAEAGERMWTQDSWQKVDNIITKSNVEFRQAFSSDFDSSMDYLRSLDLGDDVISKFNPEMTQWEASGIFKGVMARRAEEEYIDSMTTVYKDFLTKEQVAKYDGMFNEAMTTYAITDDMAEEAKKFTLKSLSDTKRKIANDMSKDVIVNKATILGNLDMKSGLMDTIDNKLFGTINTKLGKLSRPLLEAGLTGVVGKIQRFNHHSDMIAPMTKKLEDLTNGLAMEAKSLWSDEQMNLIKAYHDIKGKAGELNVADVGGSLIEVDMAAKAAVESSAGVELTKEMIQFSTKLSNFYALQRRGYVDIMQHGRYDTWAKELPWSSKYIDSVKHIDKTPEYLNYRHIQASEDYKKMLLSQNAGKALGDAMGNEIEMSYRVSRAAREDSRLRQSGGLLEDSLTNELKDYVKMVEGTYKHQGDNLLGLISADLKITGFENLNNKAVRALESVQEQWNNRFTLPTREIGAVEKAYTGVISFLKEGIYVSPKLISSAVIEPVFNVGMFKNFDALSKGYAKSLGFVPSIIKNKGNFQKAYQDILKNKVPKDEQEMFMRYFNENSDALADFAIPDEVGLSESFRKAMSVTKMAFVNTTNISKMVAFNAALAQGKKALEKAAKIDNAYDKMVALTKEANLDEFVAHDANELLDLALRNQDEFLYQFANKSVRNEIFEPTAGNRPAMMDAVKKYGGVVPQMLAFTSYPAMYYNNMLKTVANAWKNGNKEPLAKLFAMSAAWGFGVEAASNSDVPMLNAMASLTETNVPLLDSPLNIMSMPNRSIAGYAGVPLFTAMHYALKVADETPLKEMKSIDNAKRMFGKYNISNISWLNAMEQYDKIWEEVQ